jgi:hypothetical protein
MESLAHTGRKVGTAEKRVGWSSPVAAKEAIREKSSQLEAVSVSSFAMIPITVPYIFHLS